MQLLCKNRRRSRKSALTKLRFTLLYLTRFESLTLRNISVTTQSTLTKSIHSAYINSEITTIEVFKDAQGFDTLMVGLNKGAIKCFTTNPTLNNKLMYTIHVHGGQPVL